MLTRFCNCYNIVFDENGNIKACGREAVKNLIAISDQIEPDIVHGNMIKGYMNEYLIKNLHSKVTAMRS